jgi:hypothetical protein
LLAFDHKRKTLFSHLLITPLPAPIRPIQKLFIQPLHFFQLSASNTTTTCRSIWFLSFKIISLSLSLNTSHANAHIASQRLNLIIHTILHWIAHVSCSQHLLLFKVIP